MDWGPVQETQEIGGQLLALNPGSPVRIARELASKATGDIVRCAALPSADILP